MSVLALSTLALAGCSEDAESEPDAAPSPSETSATPGSASATETPYLPVPDGVELTAQGSELRIGDEAVVAYEPRQELLGVLGITVDRIDKTTFATSFAGWKLDAATKAMTPYFVQATVTNNGETDLGGRPVPLYIVDSADTLVESSTFKGTFEPCPSKPFPKVFGAGKTMSTCLVYLAPEGTTLEAVSFRPTQEFNPITWTGRITAPQKDKPQKGKPGEGDKGGGESKTGERSTKSGANGG
ncbi:hypothetical protein [Nocardioides psychrotolerans]|uniref:DUF4352 domain-containing protein n=1 Tax=Nocardioides psychrotolerans TaxID=1005945 RepID=A0A1I3FAS1_9ACTN|nr:hypothetical protein [Nocardioides psychrotolerans]SFI08272.1 hypothetical protein SAMN05216561_104299 [Nocardioides psychrotolerans]